MGKQHVLRGRRSAPSLHDSKVAGQGPGGAPVDVPHKHQRGSVPHGAQHQEERIAHLELKPKNLRLDTSQVILDAGAHKHAGKGEVCLVACKRTIAMYPK